MNEECSICIEAITKNQTVIILKCNHQFHLNCILNWENTCPNCRTLINLNTGEQPEQEDEFIVRRPINRNIKYYLPLIFYVLFIFLILFLFIITLYYKITNE
jgi:hypothetical protein